MIAEDKSSSLLEWKAVSLVSSFGSVGVAYSSSLGHFLITAVSNPYHTISEEVESQSSPISSAAVDWPVLRCEC